MKGTLYPSRFVFIRGCPKPALEPRDSFSNIPGMKFLGAVIAYGVMAFILGWGIVQAVHGSMWLLALGVIGYMTMLVRIGCLPPESH